MQNLGTLAAQNPTCCVCGRPLSNPLSVEVGIGPVCRGHRLASERGSKSQLSMFRSCYEWGISGDVLWMEDLNVGRSLSNDMENALCEVALSVYERTGRPLDSFFVAYRDGAGIWDQVKIFSVDLERVGQDVAVLRSTRGGGYSSAGVQFGFAPINVRTLEEVLEFAAAKKKPD